MIFPTTLLNVLEMADFFPRGFMVANGMSLEVALYDDDNDKYQIIAGSIERTNYYFICQRNLMSDKLSKALAGEEDAILSVDDKTCYAYKIL